MYANWENKGVRTFQGYRQGGEGGLGGFQPPPQVIEVHPIYIIILLYIGWDVVKCIIYSNICILYYALNNISVPPHFINVSTPLRLMQYIDLQNF